MRYLKNPTLVDIDVEIQQDTDNFLTIEYMNKDPENDVIFNETSIPKDKRVEIKSISINDIELDYPFENEDTLIHESLDGKQKYFGFEATKLSWNGRTTLKFTTHIWILENL